MTTHLEKLARLIEVDIFAKTFGQHRPVPTIAPIIEASLREHLYQPVRAALTDEQMRCLVFIKDYTDAMNAAPTYEQIMRHLGLKSKNGVHQLVIELESRGAITRIPYRAQSIALTKLGAITVEAA